MRKLMLTAGCALLAGFTAVAAAGPYDATPEARAYFSLNFGGETNGVREVHYGLRLNQSPVYVSEAPLPPLFQIGFTQNGLNAVRVGGLNVVRQSYRLAQAEETAAAEEAGFFGRIGNWFKNIFVGDDAEDESYPDPGTEGTFTGYNAVDWSLLAVGLAGIAFIGTEIADGSEKDGTPVGGDDGGGGCPDGTIDVEGECIPICTPDPIPIPGCIPLFQPAGLGHLRLNSVPSREYRDWLEGGTGQMGDLGG